MARLLFLDSLWYEKLGIMYISAILKAKGHQCDISIGGIKEFLTDIEKFKPDLIGFSAMTMEIDFVRKTSHQLKRAGFSIPIIVGGVHPTFFPEILEDKNIDFVCLGEGEKAIVELLEKIEQGENSYGVQNIWFKENGKIIRNQLNLLEKDLDNLPFPDREIYRKYKYFRENIYYTPVMAKRSCPYECSYCYNVKLKELSQLKTNDYVRFRSVDNVIAELEIVKEKYNPKHFLFQDGTFVIKEDWLLDFCLQYKKRVDIPFSCHIRPDRITEQSIMALKSGGCEIVRFGIESGSLRIRRDILKRNVSDEQIERTARLIKKHGMKAYTFNMMGLPTETFDEAWKTIELNQKVRPYACAFDLFIPYARTNIADFAIKKGLLTEKDLSKLNEPKYNMYKSILKQADIDRVVNLLKLYWLAIKFRFLSSFLKKLAKLPPNAIFDFIYNLSISWEFRKNHKLSFIRMIKVIMRNFKIFS